MNFTRREELAKVLGIKIGDRIKFSKGGVADVIKNYQLDFHPEITGLHILVNEKFEILPRTNILGEKFCKELNCVKCPLNRLNCRAIRGDNSKLYEQLEGWYAIFQDKELYDILKARLDKEV